MEPEATMEGEHPGDYYPTDLAGRRNDDVGRLAWQLMGPTDGYPDFSAVAPLVDALGDADDGESAVKLTRAVHLFAHRVRRANRVGAARRHLADFRSDLWRSLPHLFRPLGAALADIDRVVKLAAKADAPPEETKAEVSIVWVEPEWPASIGERLTLPDGRRGVVVRRDGRGRVGVMPGAGDDEPGAGVGSGETAPADGDMEGGVG